MTGLEGLYDVNLEWTADRNPPPPSPGDADRVPELAAPPLFTAVQEQLGLKLDARKGPLDVLVVDRAEKVPADH